jgi:hypothetical protein
MNSATNRPVLYVVLLLTCMVGTYVYKLRTAGIFACTAAAYPRDGYLAYCNAGAYGDFDHGALLFDLAPAATRAAQRADVLFLGNSRLQFGLSSNATRQWFTGHGRSHYLLGFSHLENMTFVRPLLERLRPQAKAYVINVDRFFTTEESEPGGQLLHGTDMERRYRQKASWQTLHRALCGAHPGWCGQKLAFYRELQDGHWTQASGTPDAPQAIAEGEISERDQWPQYAELARQYIASLPVPRECVLLTHVPSPHSKTAEARFIADAVGLPLIAPEVPGLQTFDDTHLNVPSAQRWSQAFFDAAGEQLERCTAAGTHP